jgi:hypothetical protein
MCKCEGGREGGRGGRGGRGVEGAAPVYMRGREGWREGRRGEGAAPVYMPDRPNSLIKFLKMTIWFTCVCTSSDE